MDDATPIASARISARRCSSIAALVTIAAFGAMPSWAAPPQPPVVTNISPAFGSVLGGTGVTFTGSNFQPPMTVAFGGSPGTNCSTPAAGSFTCNAPPSAAEGPVTVTVTNHAGNASLSIPAGYLYACASCTVSPVSMQIEGVDPGGTTEPNGILEPGESNVSFAPTWFNASNAGFAPGAFTGALSSLSTDSSYTFTAPGSLASYGAIDSGGSGACTACYSLSFSFTGARPSPHVDVTVVETPSIAGGPATDGSDARQWTIHIGRSFTDVLPSNPLYPYVENLVHNQVTFGTGGTTFSPNLTVIRGQMAAFVARGMAGGDDNIPPSGTIGAAQNPTVNGAYDCESGGTSLFADVAPTDAFCRHIHFIVGRNITIGCDATPDFCPAASVTRRNMAVFVARALVAPGGDAQVPDANTGPGGTYDCVNGPAPFSDVPTSDPNCRQIGYAWSLGIVSGFGNGTFGPDQPTTRSQMAKFIVNAFRLSLQKPRAGVRDALLAGSSIAVHPGSFTASGAGTFLLPSGADAPTFGGATLRVFDTGSGSGAANFPGTGGAQIIPLPAGQWTLQPTASGSTFVYTGVANVDPCASVTIASSGQVTANCTAGITLQTPFSGDAALILDAGSSRFCATWQGTTKKNDATGLTRTNSPAPLRCPAAQAAPQAIQFTAPIFSNGLTVYQLFPLSAATGPNVDALTITKVTQPLVRLPNGDFVSINGGNIAGCQGTEPIPCTEQIGAVSIAPDGKSLVYDLNPGEAPVPDPLSIHSNDPLGPTCGLGTVDPGNAATTGTPANPSLHCVASDLRNMFGIPVSTAECDDRISFWPFSLQFTISDGVTESTQTMVLTMFTHKCVPLDVPPPNLVIVTPPPPDPQSPPPPPLLLFGPSADNPPAAPLNTNLLALSVASVTGNPMLPSGSGGAFTVAANCPAIPALPSGSLPSCTGTGSFSIDPNSPLLQSSNGATIQLNQPLTVTSYPPHTGTFAAVTILAPRGTCPTTVCYAQSSAATLFNVTNTCGFKDQNGVGWEVDCETGQIIGGPFPI